jgi:hypothetical protein
MANNAIRIMNGIPAKGSVGWDVTIAGAFGIPESAEVNISAT